MPPQIESRSGSSRSDLFEIDDDDENNFSIEESSPIQDQDLPNPDDKIVVWTLPIPFTTTLMNINMGHVKYLVFIIAGISNLWPWNCFLSASEYFSDSFAASPSLANTYASTMMTISTITSTVVNFILSQRQAGVNYRTRVDIGQWLEVIVFFLMAVSALCHQNFSAIAYYIFVMVNVFASAVGTCFAQVGCLALVNIEGPIYANAIVVGNAIAGVLPSIALIISVLSVNPGKPESELSVEEVHKLNNSKGFAAMIYFITSSGVNAATLVVFKVLDILKARKEYYRELALGGVHIGTTTSSLASYNDVPEERNTLQRRSSLTSLQENVISPAAEGLTHRDEEEVQLVKTLTGHADDIDQEVISENGTHHIDAHVPFSYLWSKLKILEITIFLTFAITLIFPVFASTVESVNLKDHPLTVIYSKSVFIPLAYLIWNLGDLIGRIACAYPFFTLESQYTMLIYSVLRLLFIPFFMNCNIKDRQTGWIICQSDLVYMLLQFFFGFSNGQIFSSCFMNVGKFVDTEKEKKAAAGFTAVFLSVGLAFGSVLSYLFVYLIS
ncbi:unnamed protein product [[Candida] boidinii]|nr:hypothetical protein B5S33_g1829 [[Candida] boidinii]GMF02286.1 unnamed protein product [[Candida] boidinii]